jgi:hypothetical protein
MKQCKKKIIGIFQSLDYEKILGHDLWIIKNQDQKFSKKSYYEILENSKKFFFLVKFFLGTIRKSISSSPIIDVPKDKDLNIFYIRTYSRLDLKKHSEYYEKIIGTTLCVFDKRMKKIDFTIFFNCIYLFCKTNKLWSKAFKNNGVKIFSLNGLNVVLKLFNALSDSLKILPVLFNYRKLVSFTEMLATENILCQIANKTNIETKKIDQARQAASSAISSAFNTVVTHPVNTIKNNLNNNSSINRSNNESINDDPNENDQHSDAQTHLQFKIS